MLTEKEIVKAFQATLDEIIESKFDMSIDWTNKFEKALEGITDAKFEEFLKAHQMAKAKKEI